MIWFTWRQFRTQTWITVGALAVLGVFLVFAAHRFAGAYNSTVAGCTSDCSSAIDSFLKAAKKDTAGTVYNVATAVMYVIPALIGIFWGAPLIARELETGTHRLAWSQSVTRTRWLATKLTVIGGAAAVTMGLLSWAITASGHHIDHASVDRVTPLVYAARGVVPIGYALFAFALGVTAGMLIRRTVPAMATTLAVYVAAAASMAQWIRGHLVTAIRTTTPLDTSSLSEFHFDREGHMGVVGNESIPGAWILSNRTLTPGGQVFTGPTNPQYCGPDADDPHGCVRWVGTLGLRQDLSYQPDSHFWPLQWVETGILVGVAALLVGFCFWWARRRLI